MLIYIVDKPGVFFHVHVHVRVCVVFVWAELTHARRLQTLKSHLAPQAARNADHLSMSTWTEDHGPSAFVSGENDGEERDRDEGEHGDDDDEGQHPHHQRHQHQQDYRSSTVMALGNSCFGSLEYPRELPARVHMASARVQQP